MKKLATIVFSISLSLFLFYSCDRHKNPQNPAVVFQNAVTDIDGNSYDAALIGGHLWMASNLKVTRYADGTPIPEGGDAFSDTLPYRYAPDNDEANVAAYGRLYNWSAVVNGNLQSVGPDASVQGICPDGWHVPSHNEWKTMTDTVKFNKPFINFSGSVAKALATTHIWDSATARLAPGRDVAKNNATGFSAMPSGCFNFGHYVDINQYAHYWTATRTSATSIYGVGWNIGFDKMSAFSSESSMFYGMAVRCVQD